MCFMAIFLIVRERLYKQVDLLFKTHTPPGWGVEVNSGEEGGERRAKVDGLKLHISPAAASPSFELSCFVCAGHKP